MADAAFEGWAILELMGHRTRHGYLREVEIAGGKMFRIDIPVTDTENVTEFYGCAAVYSMRPARETIVRDHLAKYGRDPRPVAPLDYRPREQLPAPETPMPQAGFDDEEPVF